MFYIMEHTALTADEICAEVYGFGVNGCSLVPPWSLHAWNVTLPATPKPPVRPFLAPSVLLCHPYNPYSPTYCPYCLLPSMIAIYPENPEYSTINSTVNMVLPV